MRVYKIMHPFDKVLTLHLSLRWFSLIEHNAAQCRNNPYKQGHRQKTQLVVPQYPMRGMSNSCVPHGNTDSWPIAITTVIMGSALWSTEWPWIYATWSINRLSLNVTGTVIRHHYLIHYAGCQLTREHWKCCAPRLVLLGAPSWVIFISFLFSECYEKDNSSGAVAS